MGVKGSHNGGNAFVPIATGGKGVLAANQVQPVVQLRMKVAFTMGGDAPETKLIRELLKSFSMGGCNEKGKTVSFHFEKISTFGSNSVFLIGKALSYGQ